MSLVLTFRDGQEFFVGDVRVSVTSGPTGITLMADGGATCALSPDNWTTLLPGAKVKQGVPKSKRAGLSVVLVDAPGLPILRSKLYEVTPPCLSCKDKKSITVKEPCPACSGYGCGECVKGYISVTSKCPDC